MPGRLSLPSPSQSFAICLPVSSTACAPTCAWPAHHPRTHGHTFTQNTHTHARARADACTPDPRWCSLMTVSSSSAASWTTPRALLASRPPPSTSSTTRPASEPLNSHASGPAPPSSPGLLCHLSVAAALSVGLPCKPPRRCPEIIKSPLVLCLPWFARPSDIGPRPLASLCTLATDAPPHVCRAQEPLRFQKTGRGPSHHAPGRRITVRKSRYDLGKRFFTNVTPGYQQYPVVQLLPWADPDAPGAWLLRRALGPPRRLGRACASAYDRNTSRPCPCAGAAILHVASPPVNYPLGLFPASFLTRHPRPSCPPCQMTTSCCSTPAGLARWFDLRHRTSLCPCGTCRASSHRRVQATWRLCMLGGCIGGLQAIVPD